MVGRPNAGKSTLVNRLIGAERLLTGPEAGITRDSIAVEAVWDGREFLMFDTAGLRRRSKIDDRLEKLSVGDALEAIRFAEVVVLLMDATATFEEQDLRIADLVEREGRALVIGLNKWDLAEGAPGAIAKLRTETDHWLPQLKGVPVVAVSGLTGFGLDRLMRAVVDIHAVWNRRIADESAQPLARRGARRASAARGRRPPPQAQLHHPAEGAAAELRAVLHPRRRRARRLPALSRQWPARDVRSPRHAHPPDPARKGEPVRQALEGGPIAAVS